MLQNDKPIDRRERCSVAKLWCLEGFFLSSGQQVRVSIANLPLRIGRSRACHYSLYHASVSRNHAEIVEKDGCLAIRDLESRNGTYVNYDRIDGVTPLFPGDCVHLGSCEFRVVAENETLDEERGGENKWGIKEPGGREFLRLIIEKAVTTHFQPLVSLDGEIAFAFECLGRGNLPGAPARPDDLFRMAKRYGYARALSEIFRENALKSANNLPVHCQMFMNVHPDELEDHKNFTKKMGDVRALFPRINFVAEIPEGVALEASTLREIKAVLREFGFGFAYDDFGTGHSRLVQLCDCPPDYLKFDRSLITGIDRESAQRQDMVKILADYAANNGIITVAEGIETNAEAETCRQMGFKCGQGFLFGKPARPEVAFS